MAFDEQLRRVFDQALAELTEVARADAERARTQGLEEGRARGFEDGRAQAQAAAKEDAEKQIAAVREQAAAHSSAGGDVIDRLLDGFRAIDRARSLSETLDTIAACAGREAPRAATLLVRNGMVRGWRFIGFEQSFETAGDIDLPDAGVVSDAIATGSGASAGEPPRFLQPGGGYCFAHPLEVAGTAVAALYADGFDDKARAAGIERRLESLARHGSRALEALTALKAARAVVDPAGSVRPQNASADPDDADGSAKRYARLLVSEIKLYHEPAVVAGRRDRDLATRLGGEIARARVLYEQRVPLAVRMRTDYFRDELVRTLANGDATLLQLT